MIRLAITELRKVLQNRFFRVALAALLCVNLFLLWVVTSPMSGAYSSHAYKTMQSNLQGMAMSEKQDFINEEMRRITGLNLFMRSIIPATSNLNVLKYANLVSLLRTNEIIGGYRNLYFFAQPVSIWVVEGITALFCFALFVFAFCYVFCKASLLSA